jgi:hypothetical protein
MQSRIGMTTPSFIGSRIRNFFLIGLLAMACGCGGGPENTASLSSLGNGGTAPANGSLGANGNGGGQQGTSFQNNGSAQNNLGSSALFAPTGSGTYATTVGVGFYNGRNISEMSPPIPFPPGCIRPVIVTQAVDNSIACSDPSNPQALGICPHYNSSTSEMMSSAYGNVDPSAGTFQVFLEAADGVCTGIPGSDALGTPCFGQSPSYKINIIVSCN